MLQVEAKFVHALLLERARSGNSAPTHITLVVSKKAEVGDKCLVCMSVCISVMSSMR